MQIKRPKIRQFLAKHGFPVYTQRSLQKAQQAWQDILKQQGTRRVPQIDFYTATGQEHIIEPGYDYRSLVILSVGNEVLRTVHEAIVKEMVRNRWESKERFACKCRVCGAEYTNPKEKCDAPECGSSDWIYPDETQKQTLDAFIDDPNADDEMKDIVESLARYMLSVDDHWLSVQPPNLEKLTPLTVYVEDSIYMRVVSDEYGRIGNGEYFCPICTRKLPKKAFKKGQQCPEHPDIQLKETAYVYAEGSDVKARFAKDEVYHGMISPWRPGFYGNSKVVSALRVVLSITASDKKNLDEYSTGRVKQILAAVEMSQQEANDMVATALEQPKYKLEVNPLTGEKVVKDMQLVLGVKKDLKVLPGMPPSDKMQGLEWWKLWREAVCSMYGVTAIFVGVMESGKTGANPRMQIDVQNNTTELYQKAVEDCFNNFVLPKLGVTDWLFKFNPVEEKDEMQDVTVLNAKLDALSKAVGLGLKAELTDEGEVKVSGKPLTLEEKNRMRMEQFGQMQQKPQGEQGEKQGTGFSHEKPFSVEKAVHAQKGESWIVTRVKADDVEGRWVTINGVHVLIKPGESTADAFKRTTGKDLGSSTKDINTGSDIDSGGGKQNMQTALQSQKEQIARWIKDTPEDSPLGRTYREYQKALNNLEANQDILSVEDKESLNQTLRSSYNDLNYKIGDINLTIEWAKNGFPTVINGREIGLKRGELPSAAWKRATGQELPEWAKNIYDKPTWPGRR